MSNSRISLEDTYHLVQLAREAALAQGRNAQAERLKPVMDGMRTILSETPSATPQAASAATPKSVSDLGAQSGFKTLLELSRSTGGTPTAAPANSGSSSTSAADRNRLVVAMSAADMTDIDIARQLGMARDEVRLVIDANQKLNTVRRA